jgi:8-oxo-dGTP diphosphatase
MVPFMSVLPQSSSKNFKLTTLVYVFDRGRVLLIERKKKPFIGHWVAPGGKIEITESPYECAVRELREETGLVALDASLRGIVAETSNTIDWHWLIFVFVVKVFSGELQENDREGTLSWWPVDKFNELKVPPADKVFFERVCKPNCPFFQFKFVYENEEGFLEVQEN